MCLLVQRIRLADFRNYEQAEFEFGSHLTIIGGPNAAGKTSVVEALQLTTAGQSFRNPAWKETVRWGQKEASVFLEAKGGGRSLAVGMVVDPSGRRAYSINGQKARKVADVRGNLPSVVFGPDDLAMIKGAAEKRRGLLDSLGDQLSRTYESMRKEYDRVLKQRNAALKDGHTDVAGALAEKLIESGARYTTHRYRLLERIRPHAIGVHAEVTNGEVLGITYEQPWTEQPPSRTEEASREAIKQGLIETEDEERRRGTTVVGPHRDDIAFTINGMEARRFSSQGQQRSIALSWKLAEVAVIEEVSQRTPLLLLDDVMSELDEDRRAALISRVDGDIQTVITTTNLHYFSPEALEEAHILELGP